MPLGATANVLVGVVEITIGIGVDARVVGYTTDGVTMTIRSDFFDAKVDENIGTIIRCLTDQEVTATLNMAESALEDLAIAIPGCKLDGDTITIGGEDLQEYRLTLRGISPARRDRVIVLSHVNPTGEVTVPYKKGEVSVIPTTFSALVDDDGEFGSVVDAAVDPPVFVSATTDDEDGTEIKITFDVIMADPTGKHLEFWFTKNEDGEVYAFTEASATGAVITLTIEEGEEIIFTDENVTVSYRLGTVVSLAGGILGTFLDEEVANAVPA